MDSRAFWAAVAVRRSFPDAPLCAACETPKDLKPSGMSGGSGTRETIHLLSHPALIVQGKC
jgi:hypothetical protein